MKLKCSFKEDLNPILAAAAGIEVSNGALMKMNRATSFLVCRRGADVATAHIGTKKRFEIFFNKLKKNQGLSALLPASERRQAESCHRRWPKTVPAQTTNVMSFSLFSLNFTSKVLVVMVNLW